MTARAKLAGACTALVIAALACGIARGDEREPNARHPRLPSQPDRSGSLMYEQGAPAAQPSTQIGAGSITQGRALYATHCITCHGTDLRGTPGVPSLAHSGGAAVDFFVGTGRMPDALTTRQAMHTQAHFTQVQIAALDAYVSSRATSIVPIPHVRPDEALLQRGRSLFEDDCQACHGAAAQGATVGTGWIAPPLDRASPTQIGEAIRIGPGLMPRFSQQQLNARDVDALATYVRYLANDAPAYGGWTLDNLGPAAEGLIGAILGVGVLFWVIFFTGTKADGTRLHEK